MAIDLVSVCYGFATFSIFLIVFGIILRFMRAEQIINAIKMLFICCSIINLLLVVNASAILERSVSFMELVTLLSLSVLIYGLLAFVFVLCFFGPNETSIRMRLIALIGRQSNGMSKEEILDIYNGKTMFNVRVKRLIGAGDVIVVNNKYSLINSRNAFFLIDQCAVLLKKIYGIKN